MNPIYKTFFGKYIDLSMIISISDPELKTKPGIGFMIYFEIEYQLRDSPIEIWVEVDKSDVFLREQKYIDDVFPWVFRLEDGSTIDYYDLKKTDKPIAVKRAKIKVEEIIQAWNNYKQSEKKPIPFSYSEKSGKCPARFQDKQGKPVCRIISDHVLRECKEESCLMVHWSKEN